MDTKRGTSITQLAAADGTIHRSRWVAVALMVCAAWVQQPRAATPGLPFTEDFSDASLQDAAGTNADWSTLRQALSLGPARRHFAPLQWWLDPQTIGAEPSLTRSIAVDDMDGDGDLDVVTANYGTPPMLYRNDGGTPIVWTTGMIGNHTISGGPTVIADIDGDGALDIVFANGSPGYSYVYYNNGTSDPFLDSTRLTIPGHSGVTSVAVGDVDGNGDPDIVFGNYGVNFLYLNIAGESFTLGTMPASALDTTAVELADIDGDGDLDLVEGNDFEKTYIYWNNGTGDPWNGAVGEGLSTFPIATTDVEVADFDGDGDLDVLQGNNAGNDTIGFNNGGPPSTWTATTFGWLGDTRSLAVGDVDGDGDLDYVRGTDTSRATLFVNDGTREVRSEIWEIGTDTAPSPAVALADIDGDGTLDLLVGRDGVNILYMNGGASNPWNGQTSATDQFSGDGTPADIALGDVNGDGLLDLVVGNAYTYPNRLYLNNGTEFPWGTWQDITSDVYLTNAIDLGDVDGDGDLDVVAGNSGTSNRLYRNEGGDPVVWTVFHITSDVHPTTSVALGDVDGDGDLDVVAGNYGVADRVYLNGGGSPTSWSGKNIAPDTVGTHSVALGDVDGDGDSDLVIGTSNSHSRLYLNNGTSDPWNGAVGSFMTSTPRITKSIALGDVDGDGDLDAVEGNSNTPERLLRNDGGTPISWTVTDITADTLTTSAIGLSDVDGDGDLDVVSANNNSQVNRIYLNDGGTPIAWEAWDLSDETEFSLSLALDDVDRDGQVDVLVGNNGEPGRYYPNGGDTDPWNRFTGSDVTADLHNSRDGTLGDVDGDGRLDLVVANLVGANRLYLNNGTEEPWLGVTSSVITSDDLFTTGVVLGDVDDDGDLDVVAGNAGQANRLYRNDGGDPLTWTGFDITSDLNQTNAVALVDVDGDGDLDLLTAETGSPNRLYRNDGGDPLAWTGSNLYTDFDFSTSIAVGDVDRDGDPDVMVGTTDSSNRLYTNLGGSPIAWSRTNVSPDLHATWSVVLVDADGDGDLDALAGNLGQINRFYVNEGGSPIVWTGDDVGTATDQTRVLAVADMDRDGDADLLIGNEGQPNQLLFQHVSDTVIDMTADADSTYGLAVGDVDGDGDPDVVAINGVAPNRLYRADRYDTVRGRATSLTVDDISWELTNALLEETATYPPGTDADHWLSNDGGAQWARVQPGRPFPFHHGGSDLRWRIDLRSSSPASSPMVEQVDISSVYQPVAIGDRVWEDLDGDGIQDAGEPGMVSALVYRLDKNGLIEDVTFTDANGNYEFYGVTWGDEYELLFIPPPGYVISPGNQGGDDEVDSDPWMDDGRVRLTLRGFDQHTRWDAGMVPSVACMPPDEPVYIYTMTLTTDGNDYPVLHFMDPNQPDALTGYNVYRSSDPLPPPDTWPLVATDIIDMDEATLNKQWVDTSGDVSPSGTWYYEVTAYNHRCPAQTAEGPF